MYIIVFFCFFIAWPENRQSVEDPVWRDLAVDPIHQLVRGDVVEILCQYSCRSGSEEDVNRVGDWRREQSPEFLPPHLT